jgi:pimeloyl-ACP methyl ester carboxylesterase
LALHTHDTEREVAATSLRSNVTTQPIDPVRTSFEVVVTLAQGTPRETTHKASIAGWVFVPQIVAEEGAVSLWYLGIPGATYRGLSYFDCQVEGYPADAFSIARFLASQGIGLVVIDTLGTGESEIEANGELITRFVTAEANAQVLSQIRERLLAGMLVPELDAVPEDALFLGGFGHSMGAFQLTQLALLLQERGAPLDAAIFAGWGHSMPDYARVGIDAKGLIAVLTEQNGYYVIPRPLLRVMFYGPRPSVPAKLIEIDERDATVFPKGLLDEGLIPGIVAQEAGHLQCPVLTVLASYDFFPSAQQQGVFYRSTRLFTAFTQAHAAHCNFEDSRHEYWRAIVGWTRMVAALRNTFHLLPCEEQL